MNVVVTQSMYFPWIGLLGQVALADVVVHYDDVQFARGFFNRVQLKTATGMQWLTVPLQHVHRGQRIEEVRIDDGKPWRRQHLDLVRQAYAGAPHADLALATMAAVIEREHASLAELSRASMLALCDAFGLRTGRRFESSAGIAVDANGSDRILALARHFGATTYVTGHGGRNYLDHPAFDAAGIAVRYMDYAVDPWPQRHGEFTPFTTALDLLAHCGPEGAARIRFATRSWQDFTS